MNPCNHFTPLSSVTGLDAEGTCLTCGAQWDLSDIESATPRIIDRCPQCGPVRLSRNDIQTTRGTKGGGYYRFDCPSCAQEVYHPLPLATDLLLTAIGVAPQPTLTERDARDFEIQLGGVDCLAATAEREMAQ